MTHSCCPACRVRVVHHAAALHQISCPRCGGELFSASPSAVVGFALAEEAAPASDATERIAAAIARTTPGDGDLS